MTEITARLSTALVDRYRMERRLGEGGMATVYLAEDFKHKCKVAVKVLRSELAAVLGAERFVQEIETTAEAFAAPEEGRQLTFPLDHLFDHGSLMINTCTAAVSTVMGESEVDTLVSALEGGFRKIQGRPDRRVFAG